jgi:sn-glycerol 3-phosphate transport system substrate-binding protein
MTTGRLVVAGLGVAALVLTACGAPEGTGGPPAAGADLPPCPIKAFEDATGPIHVNFWYGEMGPPVEAVKQMVARYNASQDKVVVTATNQGNGDEVDRKYRSATSADKLPDMAELYDIPSAVDSGTILPGQSCMEEAGFDMKTINPGVLASNSFGGTFWPVYLGINEPIMYFNGAAFTAAGLDPAKPPQTLDELYDAAKALKAIGIKAPIAFQTDRTGALAASSLVSTWLTSDGQTVMDHDNGRDGDPTESTLDNAATHKIYDLLAKMKKEGLIAPTTGVNNLYALAGGSSAIAFDVSGAALGIAQVVGGDPAVAKAFQSARLPGLTGPAVNAGLPGPGFFIVNKSDPEVQGAVWDFAEFMQTETQGVKWLKEASYLPWQTDVAASTGASSYYTSGALDGRLLASGATQLADATADKPTVHAPTDVIKAIDISIQSLLTSDASVDEAIKLAVADMNTAIQRYYH